jgi:hypothetical protein
VIVINGFDFSPSIGVLEEMVEFWSFCIFSSISRRVWRRRASSRASRSICLSLETRRSWSDPRIFEIWGLAVGLMGGAVVQHQIPSNNKWTYELEQSISRQTTIEQLSISFDAQVG